MIFPEQIFGRVFLGSLVGIWCMLYLLSTEAVRLFVGVGPRAHTLPPHLVFQSRLCPLPARVFACAHLLPGHPNAPGSLCICVDRAEKSSSSSA